MCVVLWSSNFNLQFDVQNNSNICLHQHKKVKVNYVPILQYYLISEDHVTKIKDNNLNQWPVDHGF